MRHVNQAVEPVEDPGQREVFVFDHNVRNQSRRERGEAGVRLP